MKAPTRQTVSNDVSQSIVEAVAETENVSPLELPPLYGSIDPDALNRLFESPSAAAELRLEVEFVYSGYRVTVSEEGYVSVEPRE